MTHARLLLSVCVLATCVAATFPARAADQFAADQDANKTEKKGKQDPADKAKSENANGEAKDDKKDDKDEKKDDKKDEKAGDLFPDWLGVHGQGTIVSQGNWKFHSPYSGDNSLPSILNYRTTETATLYLDARLWEGADFVFNPEVSGGTGIGRTLGMAGFPNGEATRVGHIQPTPYVARAFFRKTIGFGGEQEDVEDAPNQLAGKRDISRITFTAGKMGAPDIFDNNLFSHDPRTQFLNWSVMYNGAWDYPANTRGYTYGATIEINHKDWAWRYGVFGEPKEANGPDIDPKFLKANGHVMEFEYRYELDEELPGKLRFLAFLNNAHMGSYRESLSQGIVPPDITLSRAYRVKYGFGLNVEQKLADDLGFFARLGWNDGETESWAFTEIDRTISAGLLWNGESWCRPADQFGIAVVVNGLSDAHRDYLAAGGLGFIIGDGALNYGPEEIFETFYNLQLRKGIVIGFDFQAVNHPAYNRDRGPVAIAAIRAHFEY